MKLMRWTGKTWWFWCFNLAIFSNAALSAPAPAPEVLTLENFLSQVKQKHSGYLGAVQASEGALERSMDAHLLLAPSLFAEAKYYNDKKETMNPAFMGTRTINASYSLGVSQATRYGFKGRLYYLLSKTEIENAPLVPLPRFYEAHPTLELSQSLWRDGFGAETSAQLNASEAAARAQSFGDRMKSKAILAEAEGLYWRLVAAREVVQVQLENLERAKKLKDWNLRRANLSLSDRADLLQAEANVQVRQLELATAESDLQAAERAFNLARAVETIEVKEAVEPLDTKKILAIKTPERKGPRDDVKAAEAQRNALEAQSEIGRQKQLPQLDLQGSFAINGREPDMSGTMSESLRTANPTVALGVKLVVPLDVAGALDYREGYLKEAKAAELNFQRKKLEEDTEWKELNRKLEDAKKRLDLAIKIESAQGTKIEYERERLKRGRSVTFQVLQFEQEFALSQLNRIRLQAEILGLIAQMKTFEEKADASS